MSAGVSSVLKSGYWAQVTEPPGGPDPDFKWVHQPAAVNVPLKGLETAAVIANAVAGLGSDIFTEYDVDTCYQKMPAGELIAGNYIMIQNPGGIISMAAEYDDDDEHGGCIPPLPCRAGHNLQHW
jgi:hypothetical protein